jgi:hypothetical protein
LLYREISRQSLFHYYTMAWNRFPFFLTCTRDVWWFCYMVFNATFNNISVVSWRSIVLVEETGGPGKNHRPAASHWQTLSHKGLRYLNCYKNLNIACLNVYITENLTTNRITCANTIGGNFWIWRKDYVFIVYITGIFMFLIYW